MREIKHQLNTRLSQAQRKDNTRGLAWDNRQGNTRHEATSRAYVNLKSNYCLYLNGALIDTGPSLTLGAAVFSNFSGERHTGPRDGEYIGTVQMDRKGWASFQCKRLGLRSLAGNLVLIADSTGRVLNQCTVL